jgi:hypothetical protein
MLERIGHDACCDAMGRRVWSSWQLAPDGGCDLHPPPRGHSFDFVLRTIMVYVPLDGYDVRYGGMLLDDQPAHCP